LNKKLGGLLSNLGGALIIFHKKQRLSIMNYNWVELLTRNELYKSCVKALSQPFFPLLSLFFFTFFSIQPIARPFFHYFFCHYFFLSLIFFTFFSIQPIARPFFHYFFLSLFFFTFFSIQPIRQFKPDPFSTIVTIFFVVEYKCPDI